MPNRFSRPEAKVQVKVQTSVRKSKKVTYKFDDLPGGKDQPHFPCPYLATYFQHKIFQYENTCIGGSTRVARILLQVVQSAGPE